jgi:hypothetical protein
VRLQDEQAHLIRANREKLSQLSTVVALLPSMEAMLADRAKAHSELQATHAAALAQLQHALATPIVTTTAATAATVAPVNADASGCERGSSSVDGSRSPLSCGCGGGTGSGGGDVREGGQRADAAVHSTASATAVATTLAKSTGTVIAAAATAEKALREKLKTSKSAEKALREQLKASKAIAGAQVVELVQLRGAVETLTDTNVALSKAKAVHAKRAGALARQLAAATAAAVTLDSSSGSGCGSSGGGGRSDDSAALAVAVATAAAAEAKVTVVTEKVTALEAELERERREHREREKLHERQQASQRNQVELAATTAISELSAAKEVLVRKLADADREAAVQLRGR